MVVTSSGQRSCLDSHSGPLNHNCDGSVTLPPRLPRSAGFSLVFTYRHWMYALSNIFRTRFRTNCLYSPPPFSQCRATVLSSQPYTSLTGKPSKACFTLIVHQIACQVGGYQLLSRNCQLFFCQTGLRTHLA